MTQLLLFLQADDNSINVYVDYIYVHVCHSVLLDLLLEAIAPMFSEGTS